jgi:hypothetical protein
VPSPNLSLTGTLNLPFATNASYTIGSTTVDLTGGYGDLNQGLADTVDGGLLTVAGGQVTGFSWTWENGGFFASFAYTDPSTNDFNAKSWYDQPITPGIVTAGSLLVGAPGTVSESTSAALFLGIGLLAVAVSKSRKPWNFSGMT